MFTPMPAGRTASGKSAAVAIEKQKTTTEKISFVFISQQRRSASRRIHTVRFLDFGQARAHPGHVPISENVIMSIQRLWFTALFLFCWSLPGASDPVGTNDVFAPATVGYWTGHA